ncbi:MAG: hypothetical protein JXR53_13120 [Bacteroidales bacterium]|nr:hypothetical protein [Bacteroidales bacterium]
MKKLLIISLIFASALSLNAQPGSRITQIQAKTMINKTNEYIFIARKEMRTHHVYSGDLSHAIRHQRYAIQMYEDRNYTKAFFHAASARHYANLSINANTGGQRMLIDIFSENEQNILIDNADSGLTNSWPGKTAPKLKRNNFFVDIAINGVHRRDIDHIGTFINQDKELESGDLEIEDQ